MRITLLAIAVLILGFCSNAQEKEFRKNTISVETGIFSRGLFGISYSRKFVRLDKSFLSTDGFAGIGRNGNYFGLSFNVNLGQRVVFITGGFDVKWCEIELNEGLFYLGHYSKGFAYNPYLGVSLFTNGGFTAKIRGGFMPIY